ncbi:hypothetical protein AFERRI_400081 [Acidithiobacillus ferrivorans]|uniref:Uncharacterized protein n=1 Tax=Acidithiobacillus ferrivorans TaxID=160808 RepID=A0A060UPC7_9PROT|nr:hypothetical protein AFERRI_400081 [Acidithiobacillus ferrivorans]
MRSWHVPMHGQQQARCRQGICRDLPAVVTGIEQMQVKIFTGTERLVADIAGGALGNGQSGELRAQNGQNTFARPADRLAQIK